MLKLGEYHLVLQPVIPRPRNKPLRHSRQSNQAVIPSNNAQSDQFTNMQLIKIVPTEHLLNGRSRVFQLASIVNIHNVGPSKGPRRNRIYDSTTAAFSKRVYILKPHADNEQILNTNTYIQEWPGTQAKMLYFLFVKLLQAHEVLNMLLLSDLWWPNTFGLQISSKGNGVKRDGQASEQKG